jgi:hypothetical protein
MEECIVCFEEKEHIAFPCAHKVCVECYPKLKRCPLCNYEVVIFTPDTHHTIEIRRYAQRHTRDIRDIRDTRNFQMLCCFILLAIILLALHNWH